MTSIWATDPIKKLKLITEINIITFITDPPIYNLSLAAKWYSIW